MKFFFFTISILLVTIYLYSNQKYHIQVEQSNEKQLLTLDGYPLITEYYSVRGVNGKGQLCYSEKKKFNVCDENTESNKLVLIGSDQLNYFKSTTVSTKDLIFYKWITQRKFLILNSIINDTLSSKNQVRFNSDWISESSKNKIITDCQIDENVNVFFKKNEKYEVSLKKYQKLMLYLKNTNCLGSVRDSHRFIPSVELISGKNPWTIKSINIDFYMSKTIIAKQFKLLSQDEEFIEELVKHPDFINYAKILGLRKSKINKILSQHEIQYSSEDLNFIKNTNIESFQIKYNIPKIKAKRKIVIAIIDTGINLNIPNIQSKIHNPERIPNFYGYDFSKSSTGINDSTGHGTNVAGIILGVNPDAKIIPFKYYNKSASGFENLNNELLAIKKAIDLNVDIINYSGGGPSASNEEQNLIKLAKEKGIIVINALGNEETNLDEGRGQYFPASYNLENQISVSNLRSESLCKEYNCLSESSNYSEKMDSVSFEGEDITAFGVTMTGTSQATPFITGAISLYMANSYKKPSFNDIKSLINRSSIKASKYKSKYGKFSFEKFESEINISRSIANNP